MTKKDRLLLIDRICDEVEAKLQRGSPVNIENVLESATLESRDQEVTGDLFLELIALQIVYSDDRDAEVEILKSKYPQKSGEIDSAVQQRSLLGTVDIANVRTELDAAGTNSKGASSISQLGDRFEDLEHFASGGLGDVYTGYDKAVQRRVAVKLLKPGLVNNSEAKRRFMSEGSITGMLEHPAIVPIYDSGISDDGQPFYAMRLLKGQTLKQAIEELHSNRVAGNFDGQIRSLLRRLTQVCDAISYAHDQGVIHRDLKPANILLGEFGEAVVIDWGLARREQAISEGEDFEGSSRAAVKTNSKSSLDAQPENATKIGSVLGTPEYMSPEQATGDSSIIGKRSDVYSLGAVLYSILTGASPHGGNAIATQERIENAKQADFPTAKARNASTPTALNAICERAMNVNPDSRYDSPKALASDINNWLSDQPVLARPDNALENFSRFLRKYRRWSAAAAATLVAIAVGSSIATSVINSQRTELEIRKTEAEELAAKEAESAYKARIANSDNFAYVEFMAAVFEKLRSGNNLKTSNAKDVRLTDFINTMTSELESVGENLSPRTKKNIVGNLISALNAAGKDQQALEKTRELIELVTKTDGEFSTANLIDLKGALVYSLDKNGKHEEAIALANETLAMIRSSDFPVTKSRMDEIEFAIKQTQINCFQQLKRWSEAVAIHEDLNPWLKELDFNNLPKDLEKIREASRYIDARSQVGKVPNLLQWQQKLYDAAKEISGAKDPKALAGLYRLSQAIKSEQGPAEALPYQEDLVELASEVLGVEHINTLTSKSNLAFAYLNLGRYEEAIGLYSQLRELWLKNGRIGNAMKAGESIGKAQLHLGRRTQALETFQGVLDQAISDPDPKRQPRNLLAARMNWVTALLENGKIDRAIAVFEEEIKLRNMLDDPSQHVRFFVMLQFAHLLNGDFESALLQREYLPNEAITNPSLEGIQVAESLCGLERADEAKELLEQILAWLPPEPNSPGSVDSTRVHVSNAKGLLAGIISKSEPERAEKLYKEAISELAAGYPFVMSQATRIQRPLRKHLASLVSFYEAAGNTEQAEHWRKKITEYAESTD